MTFYPGTYILIDADSEARVNYVVDNLLLPRLMNYRQIKVFDEKVTLKDDDETWQATYNHWTDAPLFVVKNGRRLYSSDYTDLNRIYGSLKTGVLKRGDDVRVSYEFDYFPVDIMTGVINMAVDMINSEAVGPLTNYTIADAPQSWDGIIGDLAFAICMERLLLDFTLWKGRLIFAIGNDLLTGGGGDITGVLETLKNNAEERANRALDNENLKSPNYTAKPTKFYYESLIVGGGSRSGNNTGSLNYGKYRGIHINKYMGSTL